MTALPSRGSVVCLVVQEDAVRARLDVPEIGPAEVPKPRLLGRLRARNYTRRIADAHVAWIRWYIPFHDKRHPAAMGPPEITRFLQLEW